MGNLASCEEMEICNIPIQLTAQTLSLLCKLQNIKREVVSLNKEHNDIQKGKCMVVLLKQNLKHFCKHTNCKLLTSIQSKYDCVAILCGGAYETFGVLHVVVFELRAHKTKYQYSIRNAWCVIVGNHVCTIYDRNVACFPVIGKLVRLIQRRRNSKRRFNKAGTTEIGSPPVHTQCEMSNIRAATINKVTFQDWQVNMTVYSFMCRD